MIKKRINNWFIHFQKYFFKYKQGFFEVSYIANSPQATIESYKKMPFFKHNTKHQTFILSNVFMKVFYKYYKIENEFWVSVSETSIYKNMKINLLYDEFIEDRYYTLSLNFVNSNSVKISNLVNNAWPLSNMSWILLKPRENSSHINFKDSNAKYIVFNFTEKWLQSQLKANGVFFNCNIEKFLASDEKYYLFLDYDDVLFNWYERFSQLFDEEIDGDNKKQQQDFNKWSNILLSYFANQFKLNQTFDTKNRLNPSENQKILEVENYLTKNLTNHFIGIEELAKLFYISPTKLKSDFKSIYGVSIYQYYLSKQMILAHQLISEKNILIKDVAAFLGYDNVSKFTIAYKKHFGFLPSDNY